MNKYITDKSDRADTRVRNFKCDCASDNTVTLTWTWPADRAARLMLVFELSRSDEAYDATDVALLIDSGCPHTVISRELSSGHTASLDEPEKRFAVCAAMFSDNKQITLLCPGIFTDVIYRKARVSVTVNERRFPFGRYKKVSWIIQCSEEDFPVAEALKYVIYKHGKPAGVYPADESVIPGGAYVIVGNEDEVRFVVSDGFKHLVELVRQQKRKGKDIVK